MAQTKEERVQQGIKYRKEHIKQTKLDLSLEYDADILARLESVGNKQGYIKALIRADIARAKSEEPAQNATAKLISLDNGRSFQTASEAISEISARNLWVTVVNLMDDDTRETVAQEGIDDDGQFLARYLELAPENLIIG